MFKKTTIYENQQGIEVKKGKVAKLLGPGEYGKWQYRHSEIFVYPKNAQAYLVPINCKSKDNASFIVDIPTMITIADLHMYYLSGISYHQEVTRVCAKHMQVIMDQLTLAELLAEPLTLSADALNKELAQSGLVIKVEGNIAIRLPRNLQNAIDAQEVARQKAKADIEEARGRTAVIRHYANTAKITKDNPDLLRLLLGQKAKSINVAFDARK